MGIAMIKRVLMPGRVFIGRLRYAYKFGLIFVMFMVPLVAVSLLLGTQASQSIRSIEQKQEGIEYITLMRSLLESMPQHRGMTNAYLNGDNSFHDRIMQKRGEINTTFHDLTRLNNRLEDHLQIGKELVQVEDQWKQVRDASRDMSPPEIFSAHTHLIRHMISLLARVADASGLIFEPYLNHLVNAVIRDIPVITETTGQLRGLGAGIAAHGNIDGPQKLHLAQLTGRIRDSDATLQNEIRAAMEKAPFLHDKLDSVLGNSTRETGKFLSLINTRLLDARAVDIDAKTVFATGTDAISASFRLYEVIIPAMNGFLVDQGAALRQERTVVMGGVVLVLLLAAYLFGGFYTSVTDSVYRISDATQRLSSGDLTSRVQLEVKDEMQQVGDSFNAMAEQFTGLVNGITDSAGQVAASAEELSAITAQSSQSIVEQQVQTEQVATAMHEMSVSVQDVAGSITNSATIASSADEETTQGRQVVDRTVEAIRQLADCIGSASEVITQLEQDSAAIVNVMDVIRGVAEQTNLLALNAAIEAARAGERGRGFAVVADEVRNLAGRTQESTEEIHQVVEKLQAGSRHAVEVMNDSLQQANKVVDQAGQADNSLQRISEAVNSINDMSVQIASAAEEQTAVAEEINRNIVAINDMGQETSLGAQQTATASEDLARLSCNLQETVGKFRV